MKETRFKDTEIGIKVSKENIMKEYERCLDDFNFDEAIVDFTIIRKNELLEQENQRLQEENMMIKNNIQEEVAKQVKEVWVKSWFKTQENMNK